MTENTHQLYDVDRALKFILAGKSRFTLVSQKTGVRFTYKADAKFDDHQYDENGDLAVGATPKLWFVSVLTSSDNEQGYTYLGQIWGNTLGFVHGKKSRIGRDAPSAKAFAYVWELLAGFNRMPANVEIWHEGMCGRCGRALTVPESIESGFGPECRGRV